MKLRFAYILTLMITANICLQAAETSATNVVKRAVEKIKQAPSLTSIFTIISNQESISGTITISGDQFEITTPTMSAWYDGKTQWTYSKDLDEVNISEPTAAELQQINPFVILQSITTGCKARRLQSTKGFDKIELTPSKGRNGIGNAVITFNALTSYPTEIIITDVNRIKTTIKITSTKQGPAQPAARFKFNAKKYPNVEIVDLR